MSQSIDSELTAIYDAFQAVSAIWTLLDTFWARPHCSSWGPAEAKG